MKVLLLSAAAALLFASAAGSAQAASVTDPVGDFLSSYTGPRDADLDVTSFSVNLNSDESDFLVSATFAGAINTAGTDPYVIGVDTGQGHIAPFASIGNPDVVFDQAVVVEQNGSATIGANSLPSSDVMINGNKFSVSIPTSLLPSTGFTPGNYGFNLWPRDGLTNNDQIADFAPNDALLSASPTAAVSAAPEPKTWLLLMFGIGAMGVMLRRRRGDISLA